MHVAPVLGGAVLGPTPPLRGGGICVRCSPCGLRSHSDPSGVAGFGPALGGSLRSRAPPAKPAPRLALRARPDVWRGRSSDRPVTTPAPSGHPYALHPPPSKQVEPKGETRRRRRRRSTRAPASRRAQGGRAHKGHGSERGGGQSPTTLRRSRPKGGRMSTAHPALEPRACHHPRSRGALLLFRSSTQRHRSRPAEGEVRRAAPSRSLGSGVTVA